MSLATLQEPNTVSVGDIELTALTLADFALLFSYDQETTEKVFTGQADIQAILTDWPIYAVKLICLASPLEYKEAERLPIGDQVNCLLTILDLSKTWIRD